MSTVGKTLAIQLRLANLSDDRDAVPIVAFLEQLLPAGASFRFERDHVHIGDIDIDALNARLGYEPPPA